MKQLEEELAASLATLADARAAVLREQVTAWHLHPETGAAGGSQPGISAACVEELQTINLSRESATTASPPPEGDIDFSVFRALDSLFTQSTEPDAPVARPQNSPNAASSPNGNLQAAAHVALDALHALPSEDDAVWAAPVGLLDSHPPCLPLVTHRAQASDDVDVLAYRIPPPSCLLPS